LVVSTKGILVLCSKNRVPTNFQNPFSILFQDLFNTKLKSLIPSFTVAQFFENLIDGRQCKNICRTVISGKEQNVNKQMPEFGIFHTFSILYAYFVQIQYFFKVLKTDFTIQFFSFISKLRGNP